MPAAKQFLRVPWRRNAAFCTREFAMRHDNAVNTATQLLRHVAATMFVATRCACFIATQNRRNDSVYRWHTRHEAAAAVVTSVRVIIRARWQRICYAACVLRHDMSAPAATNVYERRHVRDEMPRKRGVFRLRRYMARRWRR